MPTYGSDLTTQVSASLTVAAAQSAGLGPALIAATTAQASLNGDRYRSYLTPGAVQDDIQDGYLGATVGAWVLAMFSQDTNPQAVIVAQYDAAASPTPETVATALDAVEAAGVDFGGFTSSICTDVVNEAAATWHTTTNARKWRYIFVAQSASLDALEYETCRLLLVSDVASTLAAAYLGRTVSAPFISQPVAAKARVLGVTLPSFWATSSITANALAIDVGVVLPMDAGSTALEYDVYGETSYGGTDFSAALGMVYALRNIRVRLSAFWQRQMTGQIRVPRSASGLAQANGEILPVPQAMAGVGWFVGTLDVPRGFAQGGTFDANDLLPTLLLQFPGEARSIRLTVTGEVI